MKNHTHKTNKQNGIKRNNNHNQNLTHFTQNIKEQT